MAGELSFVYCCGFEAGLCRSSLDAGPPDANVFCFLNCRFSVETLICHYRNVLWGRRSSTWDFCKWPISAGCIYGGDSQAGVILSPGGHLTMSGDVFVVTSWGSVAGI